MAKYLLTPIASPVHSELDSHGLLLNLPRLEEERNKGYKHRLLDVFAHRAGSSRQGLIYGITRELGLSLTKVLNITPVLTGLGVPVLTFPAIVFEETKCTLYSNYGLETVLLTIDRYDLDGGAWSLTDLVATINSTGYFTATIFNGIDGKKRSMTIYDQTSIPIIINEDVTGKGSRIKLANENLVDGTVSVSSRNLTERVASEVAVRTSGQYYINLIDGILLTASVPEPGSHIRYMWRNDDFNVFSSPVILHNLQSTDFRTKMFTSASEEGTVGLPTKLGANIINELLSVFSGTYGP